MRGAANGTLMSSSPTDELARIAEWAAPTAEQFRDEILAGGQPAVLRAVALDWPLVIAARHDAHDAMAFLESSANAGAFLPISIIRAVIHESP